MFCFLHFDASPATGAAFLESMAGTCAMSDFDSFEKCGASRSMSAVRKCRQRLAQGKFDGRIESVKLLGERVNMLEGWRREAATKNEAMQVHMRRCGSIMRRCGYIMRRSR